MPAAEQRERERHGPDGHRATEYHARPGLALLALSLVACGGAEPASRCDVLRSSPGPLLARAEAPLTWLPADAPAYPALDARVARLGAWLVVDSGANQHAIERGAGFWLGLTSRPRTVQATDAIGLSVQLQDYGEVPVDLGLRGAPPALTLFGFEEPDLFEADVAGVLSPQRLAPPGGHVVVDLRRGRARVEPGAPDGPTALQPTCPSGDGVPLFVVDAQLDGLAGFFVVDTGSDRSSVLLEGRFSDRFSDRRVPGRLVATLGTVQQLDEVPDVSVEVAGWRGRVSIDAARPAPGRCPSDGTLGSDVLRHCVLRVGRDGGSIDCRASATSSPPRSATRRSATGS